MDMNFITPIQMPESLESLRSAQQAKRSEEGSLFKNIFDDMVKNIDETERNLEQQEYLLSTGQIDDAHTVPVAAAEAQLAVDLLVQVRNKAVEAYSELMRISL